MKPKYEKIFHVKLPYDKRHTDMHKNYGISSLWIWFILRGKEGAVQFACSFPTYLPHVQLELLGKGTTAKVMTEIHGVDVGYHAKKRQYKGQIGRDDCPWVKGKCYYDGSGLRADDWVKEIFSVKGVSPEDVVWKKLEEEYELRFIKKEE